MRDAGCRMQEIAVAPSSRIPRPASLIFSPMPTLTTEAFTATVALVGIVVIVSSLLSGAIERSGLPQVAIFLLLGVVVGPAGLGLAELSLQSPALRVIATIGLVLVLFSDAISVDIAEVRQQWRLALLVLGPGT